MKINKNIEILKYEIIKYYNFYELKCENNKF